MDSAVHGVVVVEVQRITFLADPVEDAAVEGFRTWWRAKCLGGHWVQVHWSVRHCRWLWFQRRFWLIGLFIKLRELWYRR